MYRASGIFYERQDNWGVEIERDLVRYYYSLIPPYKDKQPQKYRPHITIIRCWELKEYRIEDRETLKDLLDKSLSFVYCPLIFYKEPYYYLRVVSEEFSLLREKIGLPWYRASFNSFHITLANTKGNKTYGRF